MSTQSKSASGLDAIPYCVLKNPPIIAVLHKLFQLLFDSGKIPTEWRITVICPILKDSSSDKQMPLNYRGISLLLCISKVYSVLINKILTSGAQ